MHLLQLRKRLTSVAIFDVKTVVVTFFNRGQCDLVKSKSKQLYNMADNPVDCDFPVWGLLPKKETGVVSFLNKYNTYDGRNTVIAILDSGVDPAATGLQVTSTGEIKVIERFDCSGCGDVDTSTVVQLKDGIITGLTGRKLAVPSSWKNPSGDWHIGLLYPFSLYPTKLKERVQEHRKEHQWNVFHKTALAKAHKDQQDFEQKKGGSTNLSPEDKILKEELEARVECLQAADRKYADAGPTYDCVLFNDGTVWRAAIDTTEEGNLAEGVLLGEYSETHEHTHLTPLDQMTVSINVHSNGNLLEVTGMCSTHGTHVAAIAAANFPEEPDKNGIAPGAKIVSLTIGDSRLGSMETGTALVRACIKVMELSKKMKIDVINMSYGEHAHWSNSGRVGEIICEVVNRYGVTWIVSAGNHGPALCTVGSPPDIAQSTLIGVGAYVSPDMMSAAYSMRARLPSTAFSWSSRGPAADGAAGVAVVAPGGAITSVARFTLRGSQLLNGTSMAAPHAAGAVAVLISGLKTQSISFSPYSIKRALENSATYLPNVEPWAQGCGLLNVEKAFELLTSCRDQPEQDVTFSIKCGNASKGIHLRGRYQDSPKDIGVSVEPQFLMDCEDMEDTSTLSKKIDFNLRLSLTCNASWVHHSSYLDLMNVDRPFSVRVDTASLSPGAHFTSIQAYDVRCIEKGPVFRIPITAIQAEPLQVDTAGAPTLTNTGVTFKPGTIKRHFVIVPDEATWAVLRLRTTEKEKNGRFLVHSMQLLPRQNCKSHEYQKLITVHCQSETTLPFQVIGGVMLEVAIAKYWANVGDVTMDYTLEFRGVKPNFGSTLTFHGATSLQSIYVSTLRLEECQPSAQLKHSESVLRPSDSKLQPLTERDIIPRSRQIYQLLNTYNFHLVKGIELSPNVALLSDMLYESEFESQMWMIYNSNKQLMGVGDAYPSKYSVKLEKGDYVLRLSVRHEQRAYLEKMNDLPIILQQRLPQALTLDCYSTHAHALTGGKKFSGAQIPQGVMLPLYLTALPADKISRSHWTLGHLLTGSITFAKDELGKKVDSYTLKYVIPEMPKRNSTVGTNGKDKEKAKEDFAEALKEFKTSWLAKLDGEKLDQLYEELLEAYPDFPGLHIAYLNSADSSIDARKLPHAKISPTVTGEWCEKMKTISDKVISKIDQDKLLAQIGLKNDTRPDAQKIKQEVDKQRGNLIDALCRRGTALCRLHALNGDASGDSVAAIQSNMNNLLKFTDITDSKVIQYGVWHNFALKNWGTALKLLNKMQEERPSKEIEERLVEVYNELDWPFLVDITNKALPVKYPSGYRLF